jgi:hypothetical protein
LWNNGGANWQKELKDFEKEEDNSWQIVSRKKISYADAVRKPPLSSSNKVPLPVKK